MVSDPGVEPLNRAWYENIQKNPDVRVRFSGDDRVYRARLYPVTDQTVIDSFEKGRIPMELGPR